MISLIKKTLLTSLTAIIAISSLSLTAAAQTNSPTPVIGGDMISLKGRPIPPALQALRESHARLMKLRQEFKSVKNTEVLDFATVQAHFLKVADALKEVKALDQGQVEKFRAAVQNAKTSADLMTARRAIQAIIKEHGSEIRVTAFTVLIAKASQAITTAEKRAVNIGNRLDKLAAKGTDVIQMRALLAQANDTIAVVKSDLNALKNKIAASPTINASEIQTTLKGIMSKLRETVYNTYFKQIVQKAEAKP